MAAKPVASAHTAPYAPDTSGARTTPTTGRAAGRRSHPYARGGTAPASSSQAGAVGARVRARRSAATALPTSAASVKGCRPGAAGPSPFGSTRAAVNRTARQTGSLTSRTARQPNASRSSPPIAGPVTAPSGPSVAGTLIARPRSSGGTDRITRTGMRTSSSAPQAPWAIRATASQAIHGAAAASSPHSMNPRSAGSSAERSPAPPVPPPSSQRPAGSSSATTAS